MRSTGFVRPARGSACSATTKSYANRASAGTRRRRAFVAVARTVRRRERLGESPIGTQGGRTHVAQEFCGTVSTGRARLNAATTAAVTEFALIEHLDAKPGDLRTGDGPKSASRVAVAWIPACLLLDEPAAGLSTVETTELGSLVRRLADTWGMGILLVEHDMDLVMSICDRIVVMEFGRVIADGDAESSAHRSRGHRGIPWCSARGTRLAGGRLCEVDAPASRAGNSRIRAARYSWRAQCMAGPTAIRSSRSQPRSPTGGSRRGSLVPTEPARPPRADTVRRAAVARRNRMVSTARSTRKACTVERARDCRASATTAAFHEAVNAGTICVWEGLRQRALDSSPNSAHS